MAAPVKAITAKIRCVQCGIILAVPQCISIRKQIREAAWISLGILGGMCHCFILIPVHSTTHKSGCVCMRAGRNRSPSLSRWPQRISSTGEQIQLFLSSVLPPPLAALSLLTLRVLGLTTVGTTGHEAYSREACRPEMCLVNSQIIPRM